jgi:ketopantoate reductase
LNRYTIFGAGSVGTVLAATLRDSGFDVAIAGRNAVPALRIEGDDETVEALVDVVDEPRGTILLCVHEAQIDPLLERFAGRDVVVFCNGVRLFDGAHHGVWRMTCTLQEPGRALFTRRGRIVIEEHACAADLREAGFDVGVSRDIAADKWLKLLCNLGSTPNALVRAVDHARPEFGAVKAMLIEEARDVLAVAGIRAASCDGRDASVDEEIARQLASAPRGRPVYNDTWRQLSLGRPPQERYHQVVAGLGPAPRNAAMDRLLVDATGPECYSVDEVLSALRGASRGNPRNS